MSTHEVEFVTGDRAFQVRVEVDEDGDFEIKDIRMPCPAQEWSSIGLDGHSDPFAGIIYGMVEHEAYESDSFSNDVRMACAGVPA